MKNIKCYDIIYPSARWDYMNNNVLTSTAVLSAIWKTRNMDLLDLLLPFFEYSIAKNTNVGDKIDLQIVQKHFESEFGYKNTSVYVIQKILNRNSAKFKKDKGDYILSVNLDSDVQEFESRRIEGKKQREVVIQSLSEWLSKRVSTKYQDNAPLTERALVHFFRERGILASEGNDSLETIPLKNNEEDYYIAQFIIRESKTDSLVYKYISDMVTGFFISTAYSLQALNGNIKTAKFQKTRVYLDTRIVLRCLGLSSDEENKAAKELIQMIRDKGAQIVCFYHNYMEVSSILKAFYHNLEKGGSAKEGFTLEALVKEDATVDDVKSLVSTLKAKMKANGIEVEDSPTKEYCSDGEDNSYAFIKEDELGDQLKEFVGYKDEKPLKNDIDSIASVYYIRNGVPTTRIEESKALFLTPNIKLSKTANSFLFSNKYYTADEVSGIVSDLDLASIMWIKTYSVDSTFPQLKLLENAVAALRPSQSFLNALDTQLDKYKRDGDIDEEYAEAIRMDHYAIEEITRMTCGMESKITKEVVKEAHENMVQRIRKEVEEEVKQTQENTIEDQANKKVDERMGKINQDITNRIDDLANQKRNSTTGRWNAFIKGLLVILCVFFAVSVITMFVTKNWYLAIASVVLILVAVLEFIDYIRSANSKTKRFIENRGERAYYKEKERIKNKYYSDVFSVNSTDNPSD